AVTVLPDPDADRVSVNLVLPHRFETRRIRIGWIVVGLLSMTLLRKTTTRVVRDLDASVFRQRLELLERFLLENLFRVGTAVLELSDHLGLDLILFSLLGLEQGLDGSRSFREPLLFRRRRLSCLETLFRNLQPSRNIAVLGFEASERSGIGLALLRSRTKFLETSIRTRIENSFVAFLEPTETIGDQCSD